MPGAKADAGSSWLSNDAPLLSKVVELGGNVEPDSHNTDCATNGYALPDNSIRWVCSFLSPLGTITEEGDLQIGLNKYVPLYGPDFVSGFLPSPDPSTAVVSFRSNAIGNNIGIFHHLSKSALTKVTGDYRTYYYVQTMPDEILRNSATNAPLAVNTLSAAYSANGQWMVVNMPQTGLLRVNLEDMSTKLFAKPLEPSWFLGLDTPPLAISNDGRFVAANIGIFGESTLNIYDLSTCEDQLNATPGREQWCNGRNILQGENLLHQPQGTGLRSQITDLQSPVHLRFVDEQTLSFYAKYEVQSSRVFKTAQFVATAPGGIQHKLGLLGLGDSYISGQGAFNYKEGTDTPINPCHLSLDSYPFILGRHNFNAYNSVACSGATTGDLIGADPAFKGQVTDGVKEKDRSSYKQAILAGFLPGYIYQQEFASTYKPEAMVLSVGGDDIGFADIVKSCVANSGGGTCYDTYEDRAELVNEINNTYSKLVQTYQTLREQSGGGRLYVVGYPQVAKVGGDCGANVHLNSEEVEFSANLIQYLDSVVQKAAQTAGVVYVDTQHAFDGHRLCEAGDMAMNGLTAGKDAGITFRGHPINFIGAESYHPTKLGYQLLAQTIATQTANLSVPMPTPTPYAVPSLDPTIPLLAAQPKAGRTINLTMHDNGIINSFVLRGEAENLTLNGQQIQLQPGSKYQVVLHSNPILLDEGGVDANGNVTVTVHVPADVEPGYHTLHVYGVDMAGDSVDVQKQIYVAASESEPMGTASACQVVPASNQDADGDGVDDACDPEITTPITKVSGSVSVGSDQTPAERVTIQSSALATAGVGSQTHVLAGKTELSVGPPARQATVTQQNGLYKVDWVTVVECFGVGTFVTTAGWYALKPRTKYE